MFVGLEQTGECICVLDAAGHDAVSGLNELEAVVEGEELLDTGEGRVGHLSAEQGDHAGGSGGARGRRRDGGRLGLDTIAEEAAVGWLAMGGKMAAAFCDWSRSAMRPPQPFVPRPVGMALCHWPVWSEWEKS